MIKKKLLLIFFTLFNISIFAENLKIIFPDGLPSLALVKMISNTKELNGVKLEYKLEKISDGLIVDMLKREGDIAVVPSNFSAQLYNKNLDYKILGTVGWGSFYVITRKNINSIQELKGESIYTFGKGLTPDLIFQTILKNKGINPNKDIKINYLASGNELATLFLAKKLDTIVVSEPVLSKILRKDLTVHIVSNLNDEWKNLAESDLGFPQSTLVVKSEILEHNPQMVDEVVSHLKDSVTSLYTDKDLSINYIKKSGINIDTSLYDEIIQKSNINYVPIIDCIEEYNTYFKLLADINNKVIGGKLPNDEIYGK